MEKKKKAKLPTDCILLGTPRAPSGMEMLQEQGRLFGVTADFLLHLDLHFFRIVGTEVLCLNRFFSSFCGSLESVFSRMVLGWDRRVTLCFLWGSAPEQPARSAGGSHTHPRAPLCWEPGGLDHTSSRLPTPALRVCV